MWKAAACQRFVRLTALGRAANSAHERGSVPNRQPYFDADETRRLLRRVDVFRPVVCATLRLAQAQETGNSALILVPEPRRHGVNALLFYFRQERFRRCAPKYFPAFYRRLQCVSGLNASASLSRSRLRTQVAASIEMNFVQRATAIVNFARAKVFDALELLLYLRRQRRSFALHTQRIFADSRQIVRPKIKLIHRTFGRERINQSVLLRRLASFRRVKCHQAGHAIMRADNKLRFAFLAFFMDGLSEG